MTEREFVRGECQSCWAPVIWAMTGGGKRMPVNPEPSPAGNVALEDRGVGLPHARVLDDTERSGRTDLRTSHFATCKDAASWRKRGRS